MARRGKWAGRIPNGKIADQLIRREQSKAAIATLEASAKELHIRARDTVVQANKTRNKAEKRRLLAAAERDYRRIREVQEFLHGPQ